MRELKCGRIRILRNGMPLSRYVKHGDSRGLEFESTKLLRVPPELYADSTTVHQGRVAVVSGSVAHDTIGTRVARGTVSAVR